MQENVKNLLSRRDEAKNVKKCQKNSSIASTIVLPEGGALGV